MDREKQILSKPVDTYKHTNPQVLTLLGEKLLCLFPEEENFRSANKTLMEFALSGAKKSKCWGSVHNGLVEAVTPFPPNSIFFSTNVLRLYTPVLFSLILG